MWGGEMKKARVALVVLVIALPLCTVMALTYPRTAISFPVAFSIGADTKHLPFTVPFLHGQAQIEVIVTSGTSLWAAKILEQENVVWSYATHQAGQTTYTSGWILLPQGHYNFTYATAGLGSLEAEIKVTTKGGVW
jgi:hypothetical protein